MFFKFDIFSTPRGPEDSCFKFFLCGFDLVCFCRKRQSDEVDGVSKKQKKEQEEEKKKLEEQLKVPLNIMCIIALFEHYAWQSRLNTPLCILFSINCRIKAS